MDRISPRVIILEEAVGETINMIEEWEKQHPSEKSLIATTLPAAPKSWKNISCFVDNQLSPQLENLLRDFLRTRIQAAAQESKFVARTSDLSRVQFAFEAQLSELSLEHFVLISPVDLQIPSPVRFHFRAGDNEFDPSEPHFGRTVHSEFIADHENYRIFCEWVPRSEQMNLVLKEYRKLTARR